MKKRLSIPILIACLTLVAAACSSESDPTTTTVTGGDPTTTLAGDPTTTTAATPAEPVVVRAAITGDEDTINPYTYISGFPGWNLLMMQYDTLMQLDADGVPQPWLADTISANGDLTEYTLTIVDNASWHDGTPLTVDDVKFSLDYFIEKATGRFSRDLRGVVAIAVSGDNGIVISLAAPNPAFDLVALADIPIIPRHIWEGIDDPGERAFDISTNVGSGPFMMTEYESDQFYRFVSNPDYFRGVPAVDELVVIVFADDAGALAAIRSGEVDVSFERVSPEQIALLDAQDPLDISQGPEFTTQMINFDASKAPFSDVVVRQAMSLAIDSQDIVDTVYLGAATVGSPGWVHPGKPAYNPAVEATFDPAAANALLEGAGYIDTDGDGIREFGGEPMSFDMITNSSDSLRLRIAELTAAMLGDVGIEITVVSVETATWEEAVWPGFDINNGRNYDIAVWGWSAPVQANTIRIADLVNSDPGIGFLNLTGFSNAEVDAISSQLLTEADPATSQQLIGDLQVLLADQVPFVLLAYPDGAYVYNSEVYADWEFIAGQGIVSKVSLLPASARP
ncbi:MAG: ABC transporter substrate-binding protein [Actinomycetota bacterium]|nr:ABC transporter substrate-binding protein [Actinomycetota bacterium]